MRVDDLVKNAKNINTLKLEQFKKDNSKIY